MQAKIPVEVAASAQRTFDRLGFGLKAEAPPGLPYGWLTVSGDDKTVYILDNSLKSIVASEDRVAPVWLTDLIPGDRKADFAVLVQDRRSGVWEEIQDNSCDDVSNVLEYSSRLAATICGSFQGEAIRDVFGVELNSGRFVYCWRYRGDNSVNIFSPDNPRYDTLLAAIEAAMNAPDQEDDR